MENCDFVKTVVLFGFVSVGINTVLCPISSFPTALLLSIPLPVLYLEGYSMFCCLYVAAFIVKKRFYSSFDCSCQVFIVQCSLFAC